ncbi:MAG: DUF2125 domain-containing protein [Rhodospirillaceae bacterium]
MSLPRRLRSALIYGAGAAVAAACWYGWWLASGAMLNRALADFVMDERARGGTVEIGSLELSGFPFHLHAEARDVALSRPDGSGWRTPVLVAEAPLWAVTSVGLSLVGPQSGRLPGGQAVTAAGGVARLGFSASGVVTLARLSLAEVRGTADGPVVVRLEVAVDQPERPPATGAETGLTLSVGLDGLLLPPATVAGLPLGRLVERVGLNIRLQGAPPALDTRALTAWTQSGGSLAIDKAELRWGPVSVRTTGALELDRDLQPVGSLPTEIAGFGPAVEALAAAGWIRAKDVPTIKAVLSGLSPRSGGGPATAKLPLSLRERFVQVGPFRVARLPAVVWSGDQRIPNQTTEAAPATRQ